MDAPAISGLRILSDRPVGSCTHTFSFEYAGLAVIEAKVFTSQGRIRVAFPAKRRRAHCVRCDVRIGMVDRYCRWCGVKQPMREAPHNPDGPARLWKECVFPARPETRPLFELAILREFYRVLETTGVTRE